MVPVYFTIANSREPVVLKHLLQKSSSSSSYPCILENNHP